MAIAVATLTSVTVNGTDISTYLTSARITYSRELIETTAFQSTTRTRTGGLYDWQVELSGNMDYADNTIDELFHTSLGTSVAFLGRPSTAAISASNPEYTGNVIWGEWSVMNAQHGQLQTFSVTLMGNGALTRDITP
jgi:hypothetical protein